MAKSEQSEQSNAAIERVLYSKYVHDVQTALANYDQRCNPTPSYGAETEYCTPLAHEERTIGWLLLGLGAEVLKRAGLLHAEPLPTQAITIADKPRRLKEVSAHLVQALGHYYAPLAAGDDIDALTLTPEELLTLEAVLGPQLVKVGMMFLACAHDRGAMTVDIAEPGPQLTPPGALAGGSR